MQKALATIGCLLIALGPMPALANPPKTADMFGNPNLVIEDAPFIAGNNVFKGDVFHTTGPYLRTDKDMFDAMPRYGTFGAEDLFYMHRLDVPEEPLYAWPGK